MARHLFSATNNLKEATPVKSRNITHTCYHTHYSKSGVQFVIMWALAASFTLLIAGKIDKLLLLRFVLKRALCTANTAIPKRNNEVTSVLSNDNWQILTSSSTCSTFSLVYIGRGELSLPFFNSYELRTNIPYPILKTKRFSAWLDCRTRLWILESAWNNKLTTYCYPFNNIVYRGAI